ncbi:MAG: hypothetical protein ACAH17_02345 [Candidatus Paceibacterota bacterium]
METRDVSYLERFFEDIPFPIHKSVLVEESLESSLPSGIREAIVLLPDIEYSSKEEVTRELLGHPSEDDHLPKKDPDALVREETDDELHPVDSLDEFTKIDDEEDHETL